MLTLGSLFDGIGGWQVSGIKAGVKPVWSSEIEPFPLAVTKLRFPNTIQLGDITKIDGAKLPPVDIICMGSPCQDLSIAGKREGLDGERSGLFRDAIRIVRSMRNATGGYILGLLFGKTFQERSQATEEWTSALYWRNIQKPVFQCLNLEDGRQRDWLEADDAMLPGDVWMLNIGVSPNDEIASFLSWILQKPEDVPQKYYLSQRACAGILRRAKVRGKDLPELLKKALQEQAIQAGWKPRERLKQIRKAQRLMRKSNPSSLKFGNQKSRDGGGAGAMWQENQSYTLATHQDQTLFQPNSSVDVLNDRGGGGTERIEGEVSDVVSRTGTARSNVLRESCTGCTGAASGCCADLIRKSGNRREQSTDSDGEYP